MTTVNAWLLKRKHDHMLSEHKVMISFPFLFEMYGCLYSFFDSF